LLAGVEGGEELARRLVILPDDDYVFLAETATEVRARVRIDEDPGALWYEENLPAETLLWGVAAVGPSHMKGAAEDDATVNGWLPAGGKLLIQIGGKHTVGRGLCQWWLA
jgi:CRISPR-associated protein Cmr4